MSKVATDKTFVPVHITLETEDEVIAMGYIVCNPIMVNREVQDSYAGSRMQPRPDEIFSFLDGLREAFPWREELEKRRV